MMQQANLTTISVSCCLYSGELIKDLNSSDEVTQQNALKAANGYIAVSDEHCSRKVNTTRINTNPPASACQVNTCAKSHCVQHKSMFLYVLFLYVCLLPVSPHQQIHVL